MVNVKIIERTEIEREDDAALMMNSTSATASTILKTTANGDF